MNEFSSRIRDISKPLLCFLLSNQLVEVPTESVSSVIDATGAGDAFLGGLVSGQ